MSIAHLEIRQKVITYAHKLQAERLVYSTAGNISVRVPDQPRLLACTPSSVQYDLLEPADIAIVIVGWPGMALLVNVPFLTCIAVFATQKLRLANCGAARYCMSNATRWVRW